MFTFLVVSLFLTWIFPALQAAIAIAGRKGGPREIPDNVTPTQLKRIFIMIPALNEQDVIAPTVLNTLDLDTPEGCQVEVVVINDGSSDNTAEVLANIHNPRLHVINRTLPHAQQGKGKALNAGYRYISHTCAQAGVNPHDVAVGILDADGRASHNMLTDVASLFANPNVAAVQCRVFIRNKDSFWGLAQAEEFSVMVNASQNMRDRIGSTALGGNAQFTRLSDLETLGEDPWTDCLVEDLDLGLRLHAQGKQIRYTSESSVTQQALSSTRRLLRQRTRWSQGNIQCLEHVPKVVRWRHLNALARAEMLVYLLASIAALIGTAAIIVGIGILITHPLLDDIPDLIVWVTAFLLPSIMWATIYARKIGNITAKQYVLLVLGYPALVFLTSISILRGWYSQVRGKRSWAKTAREQEGRPAVSMAAVG